MVEDELVEELSEKYNKREEYIKFLIKICNNNDWDLFNVEEHLKLK